MKEFMSLILAIALCCASVGRLSAQTPQDQDEVIRFRTNEVKLDIVVKDKKGRPVKDLTAADFQILEDGVGQQIQSFMYVNRDTQPAPPDTRPQEQKGTKTEPIATTTISTPAPVRTSPGVTALVFDRLSPEARSLAKKAGLAYAQDGMAGGDYTGVFRIDQSLSTIQQFTDNMELLKVAIDNATSATGSTYGSTSQRSRDIADRSLALDRQLDASAAGASSAGGGRDAAGAAAAGAAAGAAAQEQTLLQMENNINQSFEALERDQQGFATINGLLAVINPMRNLPGRKTIIFFSEGLKMPTSVQAKFPSVISAANRANVSIYSIDAGGLRIASSTGEARDELNALAAQRLQQQGRRGDRGEGPYMKALERNEELLTFDPRSGLGRLADQTGGFLISDTNDLTTGLRRINDDMHGYYLVTYMPKNDDYNGKFRQISVKLKQSSLDVQARKGYYAVESLGQLPVLDYEAPAIAAARKATESSKAFSFGGSALSFPAPSRPGLSLVLAEASLSAFSFAQGQDEKTYNTDFSIVALVRDKSSQVVQKLSQHYALNGPLEKLAEAKKGDVLFYREVQLPPGKYTVELIAYDAQTGKVNVRNSIIDIPSIDETKPRISSVAVLRRAEQLTTAEQQRDQPFRFGELLVYPNLGEVVLKSQAKQLAYFFTAWNAKGSTTPLKLTLEIFQGNRSLAKTSGPLPAADDKGQIKYASSFPLDKFQPGAYRLKITVSDDKNSASSATNFTVAS